MYAMVKLFLAFIATGDTISIMGLKWDVNIINFLDVAIVFPAC
jgi:hypothetical protein